MAQKPGLLRITVSREGSAEHAVIFTQSKDPIIAVKVNRHFLDRFRKKGYYIGIYKWD